RSTLAILPSPNFNSYNWSLYNLEHGETAQQNFVAVYVHQDATVLLTGPLVAGGVGLAQSGDVFELPIYHRQSVQAASAGMLQQ
ncbi:MAG: hypothetical protein GY803_14925, partial [Chloroflexi bacterium]|nr:hypothetical protein [Chloroflexota bacterium]